MASDNWYRVDRNKVAHETIDGEVIIIHLGRGNYFSLDGMGADLWEFLVEARGREDTIELLARRYEAVPDLIAETVDELVGKLAEEELVEPGLAEGDSLASDGQAPVEKQSFKPPRLQKYTDMQDFLLVDPIHEVDETGWVPQQAAT